MAAATRYLNGRTTRVTVEIDPTDAVRALRCKFVWTSRAEQQGTAAPTARVRLPDAIASGTGESRARGVNLRPSRPRAMCVPLTFAAPGFPPGGFFGE